MLRQCSHLQMRREWQGMAGNGRTWATKNLLSSFKLRQGMSAWCHEHVMLEFNSESEMVIPSLLSLSLILPSPSLYCNSGHWAGTGGMGQRYECLSLNWLYLILVFPSRLLSLPTGEKRSGTTQQLIITRCWTDEGCRWMRADQGEGHCEEQDDGRPGRDMPEYAWFFHSLI